MAKHAEGCEWKDISFHLYQHNDNAPDESLTIDCGHLSYDSNVPSKIVDNDVRYITFNFCPVCGCKLSD
jgi:hypothetical protein